MSKAVVLGGTAAISIVLAGTLAMPRQAHADTLREALESAYETNPTLQAARSQQRATDEGVPLAKVNGLPSANASARLTESLQSFSPIVSSFNNSPNRNLQAGIDLSVPVYSGGSVKNSVLAAKERISAGQADLRGTESTLFSQVVAAYMDVIRNEAVTALSANQVDVLSVNLEATRDRFEIGDLTRTDIAQSQSRLAIAQSDLRSAESNLVGAREVYIQLVGKAPDNLQPPPPLPGMPGSVAEAVEIALEFNPDLVAARERAQATEYDIKVAKASRMPKVSLFANGNYTNYLGTYSAPPPNIYTQGGTAANAGVQVSIPLYQGGRPAALQRQATAGAAAALDQIIATERNVIAQVRAAYSSWQAANAIILSSKTAVSAAELGLEGVRAENSIGNRTILDVLNAEQELLSARVKLVTARRNAYVAGFTVLAAMGRAEARDLGLEEEGVLYDPITNYKRVENKRWDWDYDAAPLPNGTRTIDIPAANANIPAINKATSESQIK